MFKKRTRPTSVRDKTAPEAEAEIDIGKSSELEQGEPSGSKEQVVGEDEGDETARTTIEELVLLRKLRKSQAQQGIDLAKLNRGEEKRDKTKGKKKDDSANAGGGYGLQGTRKEDKDEEQDDHERAKRLVRSNNFTQQTNALDVDKHMMAYIESELAKRRGQAAEEESAGIKNEPFDPQAELYKIADRYKIQVKKGQKQIEAEEGSVTNSLGMLTAIPEVDLGMDNRLKNIELTEKAKREMMEQRKLALEEAARRKEEPAPDYAAARFYRPHQRVASDIYVIQDGQKQDRLPKHESATDEKVYERFKKRMKH